MRRAKIYLIGTDICDIRRRRLFRYSLVSGFNGVLFTGSKKKCYMKLSDLRWEERRRINGVKDPIENYYPHEVMENEKPTAGIWTKRTQFIY